MYGGLDVAAREFSVYNNLNYRNSTVRNALDSFFKTPSAFGGFQSGSTVTASFHKIHRNGYDKQFIGATKLQSKKIFDNGFVQTQLPATDLQYLWITSSFQNTNIRR